MHSYTIQELKIGQQERLVKTISEDDTRLFAQISGDHNPVHEDEEYAKKSVFGARIVHGLLVAGYISTVIGMQLPGPGAIYMGQTLKFLKPVYIGDTITAIVTLKELDEGRNRITLETNVFNQDNQLVLSGEALVKPAIRNN